MIHSVDLARARRSDRDRPAGASRGGYRRQVEGDLFRPARMLDAAAHPGDVGRPDAVVVLQDRAGPRRRRSAGTPARRPAGPSGPPASMRCRSGHRSRCGGTTRQEGRQGNVGAVVVARSSRGRSSATVRTRRTRHAGRRGRRSPPGSSVMNAGSTPSIRTSTRRSSGRVAVVVADRNREAQLAHGSSPRGWLVRPRIRAAAPGSGVTPADAVPKCPSSRAGSGCGGVRAVRALPATGRLRGGKIHSLQTPCARYGLPLPALRRGASSAVNIAVRQESGSSRVPPAPGPSLAAPVRPGLRIRHDLSGDRQLHPLQVHGLRRGVSGQLLLRRREHARHPSGRVHRLRRMRARVSCRGDQAGHRAGPRQVAEGQHRIRREVAEHHDQA